MRNTIRRAGAAAAALLTATAMIVAGSGLASAADPAPSLPTGTTGSLSIVDKTTTGVAVVGAEYTVTQVLSFDGKPIDLTTNQGWADVSAVTIAGLAGAEKGTPVAVKTNASGEAKFPALPIGLYYVTQTITPPGAQQTEPFLVTIPTTNDDRDGWLYDVTVSPKEGTVGKTVTSSTADRASALLTWTIVADIPRDAQSKVDAYKVVDNLDSRLIFESVDVSLSGAGVTFADGDYIVLAPTVGTSGGTVTVEFTPHGLGTLAAAAAQGLSVKVDIATRLTPTAEGVISNTAEVYPNQWSVDTDTPDLSVPATSSWGGVVIQKSDQANAPLAGATFELYPTKEAALAGTGNLTIGGANEWTSGGDGQFTIDGIAYGHYWLLETVAPEGYELLAEPVEVVVEGVPDDGTNPSVDGVHDGHTVDKTITNVKKNAGFELPLTGGSGTALLTIGGVAVLGAAAVLLLRGRRRVEQD